MQWRAYVAEVPVVHNQLDALVDPGELFDSLDRTVFRGIVDEHDLKAHIRDRGEGGGDPLIKRPNVLLLVVAGGHNTDEPPRQHLPV